MVAPPDFAIEAARLIALHSPCRKTQRGVVLFHYQEAEWCRQRGIDPQVLVGGPVDLLLAQGSNGQPKGFHCSDDATCRKNCGLLCMHAEQRAIMQALVRVSDLSVFSSLDLVHVKVVGGQVVAGGGPGCLQCSRLCVEVGLRGVWLYELPSGNLAGHDLLDVVGEWRFYLSADFHQKTIDNEVEVLP